MPKDSKPMLPLKGKVVAWPDWQEADDYPPADIPLEGWAWEFLRRNSHYQEQWDAYVAKTEEIAQKFGPPSQWGSDVQKSADVWFFDPPIYPGETQSTWRSRAIGSGQEPVGPLPLAVGMAIEWGLEEMFNPSFSWLHVADMEFRPRFRPRPSQPHIRYYVGDIEDWTSGMSRAMWPLPVPYGSALVEIDMGRSIGEQMEVVLPILEAKRAQYIRGELFVGDPLKGPRTENYPSLLRVYDAYKAKSGLGEVPDNEIIADKLYGQGEGTSSAIAHKYQRAAAFVNKKGYLRLLS